MENRDSKEILTGFPLYFGGFWYSSEGKFGFHLVNGSLISLISFEIEDFMDLF